MDYTVRIPKDAWLNGVVKVEIPGIVAESVSKTAQTIVVSPLDNEFLYYEVYKVMGITTEPDILVLKAFRKTPEVDLMLWVRIFNNHSI